MLQCMQRSAQPRRRPGLAKRRRAEEYGRRLRALRAKVAPKVPGIDPHDLDLILGCLLKPPAKRLVFLRAGPAGGYVF